MNEWQALVIQRIQDTINDIPDGTCCSIATPLSYTQSDEIEPRAFLRDKVCTSMDKAAGTIMFNCQCDYVDRMQTDLDANAVFEINPRAQSDIVHDSNELGSRWHEEQISKGVITVAQSCCEPVLQSSTEQWGSYSALLSAAVHWCCITAHLYQEQIPKGVIAVAHSC